MPTKKQERIKRRLDRRQSKVDESRATFGTNDPDLGKFDRRLNRLKRTVNQAEKQGMNVNYDTTNASGEGVVKKTTVKSSINMNYSPNKMGHSPAEMESAKQEKYNLLHDNPIAKHGSWMSKHSKSAFQMGHSPLEKHGGPHAKDAAKAFVGGAVDAVKSQLGGIAKFAKNVKGKNVAKKTTDAAIDFMTGPIGQIPGVKNKVQSLKNKKNRALGLGVNYKEAYVDADKNKYPTQESFTKAAKAYNNPVKMHGGDHDDDKIEPYQIQKLEDMKKKTAALNELRRQRGDFKDIPANPSANPQSLSSDDSQEIANMKRKLKALNELRRQKGHFNK
jgi:hypothetical protein